MVNNKFWEGMAWGLFFSAILWGLIFIGVSQATTYYVRPDGTVLAADKANATSCSATSTTLSIAQVNLATFSGDDIIDGCGTSYTHRAQITVPSSGTSGHQLKFQNFKIYGSTAIATWDQDPIGDAYGTKDLLNEGFKTTVGGENHFTTAGTGHLDNAGWTGTLGSGSTLDADSTTIADSQGGVTEILKVNKVSPNFAAMGSFDYGSEVAKTYFHAYINITVEGLANGDEARLVWAKNATDTPWAISLIQTSGQLKWQLSLYNNGAWAYYTSNMAINTWYRLEVYNDVTNHLWGFKIDGAVIGSGTITGTHYGGVRYLELGSGAGVAKAVTAYFDLVYLSSNGWQTGQTALPDGTWKAACATAPTVVFFVAPTTGVITWGKQETVLVNVNAEYDWYHDGTYLVVYAATTPDTRYASVEASARDSCIVGSEKNYITVTDIECAFASNQGISTQPYLGAATLVGTNWIVSGNTIHHVGAKGSAYSDGVKINGSNCSVQDNIIYEIGTHGIYVVTGNDAVTVDTTLIEGNEIYNCYHTLIDVMNIHGTLTNTTISKNNLYYTTAYDYTIASNGIFISGDTADHEVNTVNISYNLLSNVIQAGIQISGTPGSVKNFNVDNNSIYERLSTQTSAATYGISLPSYVDAAGTNNVRNNIISMTLNTAGSYLLYVGDGDDLDTLSNNILHRIGGTGTVYVNVAAGTGAGSYHSDDQAAYITAMGGVKATGTLFTDPLFVSATDFHLQPTSPCINAGASVSLTTDYSGRPIQLAPDMGAYEYEIRRRRVN